jgi:hypothetical protein
LRNIRQHPPLHKDWFHTMDLQSKRKAKGKQKKKTQLAPLFSKQTNTRTQLTTGMLFTSTLQ